MIDLDQFTERARRALTLANIEARYVVTGAVEPGHLLFGVVQEDVEAAAQVSDGTLTPEDVRRHLKRLYAGRLQAGPWESEEMKLSEAAQRTLARAQQEARKRGSGTVDLPHLLLALISIEEAEGARLLSDAGVNTTAVETLLRQGSQGPGTEILER